jgi:hypothetical protein
MRQCDCFWFRKQDNTCWMRRELNEQKCPMHIARSHPLADGDWNHYVSHRPECKT